MPDKKKEIVIEGNIIIGTILVKNGYLTREQLLKCIKIYRKPDNKLRLGEIAVEQGYVTKEVVEKAVRARDKYVKEQKKKQAKESKKPPKPPKPPAPPTAKSTKTKDDAKELLMKWLTSAVKGKISDVHVKSGKPLIARKNGKLMEMKMPPIELEKAEAILKSVLDEEQLEELEKIRSVSLSLDFPGGGRARASIFYHFRGIDGAFRIIPPEIPTLADLNLPSILARFTTYSQGLVLVTGPTSSGKSTTLAALVDIINRDRRDHILTVENPIEFVHPCHRSLVTERQVGMHTQEVSAALRAALREDPDVIVVGEMNDTETAHLTISAAETGHLVFATLHTNNAVRSVNRVIDMFPPEEQPQIRTMLSESLRGVISQRLVPKAAGDALIPLVEIMFTTTAISNLIRERKNYQIPNVIKISKNKGNTTFEDYAIDLHEQGLIDDEVLAGCMEKQGVQ